MHNGSTKRNYIQILNSKFANSRKCWKCRSTIRINSTEKDSRKLSASAAVIGTKGDPK